MRKNQEYLHPRHRWGGKDFLKIKKRERERRKGVTDLLVGTQRRKEVHGGQDITAAEYWSG